jgi:hypothetical protein
MGMTAKSGRMRVGLRRHERCRITLATDAQSSSRKSQTRPVRDFTACREATTPYSRKGGERSFVGPSYSQRWTFGGVVGYGATLARPYSQAATTFTLKDVRARVRRLEEFPKGLSEEVEGVKDAERSVLLPGERRQYLNAVMDVIAGAEAARAVMQKAVKRLERSGLSEEADAA